MINFDLNCVWCDKKVDKNSFKDDVSINEFFISGLCQGCQDEVFDD